METDSRENGGLPEPAERRRFSRIVIAGITFQGGSAAVDSSTIMAALVFQLTGSPIVVGAIAAILRFGWLFPQLIVGFLAERRASSMLYYVIGGFGRALCMAMLALILFVGSDYPAPVLAVSVLFLWFVYSFVSGIVAVPYNDIVARSVASSRRSRLLAVRFFGGGLLAMVVAVLADVSVGRMPFPTSYAAIIAMAAVLMALSATIFVSMGEPRTPVSNQVQIPFAGYLREGLRVFRTEPQFRSFVYAQWCGGAVLMAMPFYVVQGAAAGFDLTDIAILLGAQTAGALISNLLWGWWGDHLGKGSLLQVIALGRALPPMMILVVALTGVVSVNGLFFAFAGVFFILGALANGLTIAVIGFLMEISPEDKRPSYSGYFNALTAPAFLLPFFGGMLAEVTGLGVVFTLSLLAAVVQFAFVRRLRRCLV